MNDDRCGSRRCTLRIERRVRGRVAHAVALALACCWAIQSASAADEPYVVTVDLAKLVQAFPGAARVEQGARVRMDAVREEVTRRWGEIRLLNEGLESLKRALNKEGT